MKTFRTISWSNLNLMSARQTPAATKNDFLWLYCRNQYALLLFHNMQYDLKTK